MSVSGDSNGQPSSPQEAASLLSNLPRTRPQRATPRRTAARDAKTAGATQAAPPASSNGAVPVSSASAEAKARTRPAKPKVAAKAAKPAAARRSKPKARTASPRRATAPAAAEPVPLQGFESESDHAHGAVHPPSGAEMVASATEMLGELAKAGFSMGERLLKDAFSRLPLS